MAEEIVWTPAMLERAAQLPKRRAPRGRRVTLELDADVLDYFRAQGRNYQVRINAVLRAYMESLGER